MHSIGSATAPGWRQQVPGDAGAWRRRRHGRGPCKLCSAVAQAAPVPALLARAQVSCFNLRPAGAQNIAAWLVAGGVAYYLYVVPERQRNDEQQVSVWACPFWTAPAVDSGD